MPLGLNAASWRCRGCVPCRRGVALFRKKNLADRAPYPNIIENTNHFFFSIISDIPINSSSSSSRFWDCSSGSFFFFCSCFCSYQSRIPLIDFLVAFPAYCCTFFFSVLRYRKKERKKKRTKKKTPAMYDRIM